MDSLLVPISCNLTLPHVNSGASWRSCIVERLQNIGLQPVLMPFLITLARGVNIFVDIPPHGDFPRRLVGAHYEGTELHDNQSGVLALLDIATFLNKSLSAHTWRIAFGDAEERFQQGSRSYLKDLRRGTPFNATTVRNCHDVYFDIDGISMVSHLLMRPVKTRLPFCRM